MNSPPKKRKISGPNWQVNSMGSSKQRLWIVCKKKFQNLFQDICEDEFQVRSTPTVYAFSSNIDHDPVRFTGSFNEKELANFAVQYMESFVEYVSSNNYEEFIKKDVYKVNINIFRFCFLRTKNRRLHFSKHFQRSSKANYFLGR